MHLKKEKIITQIKTLLKGAVLTACTLSFCPYLNIAGVKGVTNGDYSHVIVIPLIALVVYLRSERVEPQKPHIIKGSLLLACGIALRGVGEYWSLPLVAEVSFPLLFIGFVELLFGHGEARRVLFPALFLLFSFGFVTDILLKLFVHYLVLVSAGAACDAATTFVPHLGPFALMGNTIMVPPNIRFDVVDECSGIRGILALYVLSSLIGYAKKLSWRSALRLLLFITVASVATNLLRIAVTIVTALILRNRISYHFLHEFWNYVFFGTLIMMTPLFANWAQRLRLRFSLVGILAILMILVHIFQWHVHASEGNVNIVVHQIPNKKPEVTLKVDQYGVPPAFLPYVSSEVDGHRYCRWIITSAFVHSNVSHLAINVFLLLMLGYAIRNDLRWTWTGASMLAGQVIGTLSKWPIHAQSTTSGNGAIVLGASCAVSGLFGAYLVAHLLAHRKWVQATLFFAIYIVGLWLSAGHLGPAYQLSFLSHLAGLAAGMSIASLYIVDKLLKNRHKLIDVIE